MSFAHQQFEYAAVSRRAAAFVLDTTIISLISSAALLMTFGIGILSQSQQTTLISQLDWRILSIEHGLPALWVIGFWLLWQATPGKMLLDCQIVDARSQRKARPTQLIIRYLGYFASALPLGLGFAWALIDKRNQAWHDKLSETMVIMQDASRHPLEDMQ